MMEIRKTRLYLKAILAVMLVILVTCMVALIEFLALVTKKPEVNKNGR